MKELRSLSRQFKRAIFEVSSPEEVLPFGLCIMNLADALNRSGRVPFGYDTMMRRCLILGGGHLVAGSVLIDEKKYVIEKRLMSFAKNPEKLETGWGFFSRPVEDYDNGTQSRVFAVAKNNLVVLMVDVKNNADKTCLADRKLYEAIIAWACALIDPKQYPPFETERARQFRARQMMVSLAGAAKELREGKIRELVGERTRYLEVIMKTEKNIEKMEMEMVAEEMLIAKKDFGAEADAFIKALETNSKVKRYEFGEGGINIFFHKLLLRWDEAGKTYKLPELRVYVPVGGGGGTFQVHFTNEAREGTCRPHPHIFHGGEPCLGNYLTIYEKLLRAGKYKNILDLLLEFLETYNDAENDGPASFENWVEQYESALGKE